MVGRGRAGVKRRRCLGNPPSPRPSPVSLGPVTTKWGIVGPKTWARPNPIDRTKPGVKRSLLVEADGGRLAVTIARANVPDAHMSRFPMDRSARSCPHRRRMPAEERVGCKSDPSSTEAIVGSSGPMSSRLSAAKRRGGSQAVMVEAESMPGPKLAVTAPPSPSSTSVGTNQDEIPVLSRSPARLPRACRGLQPRPGRTGGRTRHSSRA